MKKLLIITTSIIIAALALASCGDLTAPTNAIAGGVGGLLGGTIGGSSSSGSTGNPTYDIVGATSIIEKELWDTLFPGRWGVGEYWEWVYKTYKSSIYNESTMKFDLYSYENFATAVNELQYIKLKLGPQQDNYKAIYRWDTRYDSGWVYVCNSDEWTPWNSTEEEIIDLSHFINKPGAADDDKTRELCAFLANISHEVGENEWVSDGVYNYHGLFYREEINYELDPNAQSYISSSDANFPPVAGKSYHGRGPIQLSWNYNYGSMSAIFLNDKNTLLNNPDLVKENGVLAFLTAIWFWMMPQGGKPSCHEVMYPDYVAGEGEKDVWGFGHTVVIINGGYEGSGNMAVRRGVFYEQFLDEFGITYGTGEAKNTDSITSY